ncbi:MAG: hypothetical protein AAF468_07535 [Pseudomonadota bacterium]
MFNKLAKATTISLFLALGGAAVSTAPAQAFGHGVGIGIEGPGFSVHFGEPGYHRHRPHYRPYRFCRPGRALRKARRMGVRRAHIVRASRRGVVVAGRRYGHRIVVGFSRAPRCPVRFVRRGW